MKSFKDPLSALPLAESVFKITDFNFFGLKNIGECKQKITSTNLLSKVRINITPVGSSVMTTTCTWIPKPNVIDTLEVTVQTTEVLESSFLGAVDSLPFPSKLSLESIQKGSATVDMRITYLDESLRIVRNDSDNKVFVFTRIRN